MDAFRSGCVFFSLAAFYHPYISLCHGRAQAVFEEGFNLTKFPGSSTSSMVGRSKVLKPMEAGRMADGNFEKLLGWIGASTMKHVENWIQLPTMNWKNILTRICSCNFHVGGAIDLEQHRSYLMKLVSWTTGSNEVHLKRSITVIQQMSLAHMYESHKIHHHTVISRFSMLPFAKKTCFNQRLKFCITTSSLSLGFLLFLVPFLQLQIPLKIQQASSCEGAWDSESPVMAMGDRVPRQMCRAQGKRSNLRKLNSS